MVVAMLLADCVVWSVEVRVSVWTLCLEHLRLDIVYRVV